MDLLSGLEDQLTVAITGAVTFVSGWLLDNKVPRKVAKWTIGLFLRKPKN